LRGPSIRVLFLLVVVTVLAPASDSALYIYTSSLAQSFFSGREGVRGRRDRQTLGNKQTNMNALFGKKPDAGDVEFWHGPERAGWLMKQGEYIKTWRRRWFVLKQGKIFWFKSDIVTPVRSQATQPCLSKPSAYSRPFRAAVLRWPNGSTKTSETWRIRTCAPPPPGTGGWTLCSGRAPPRCSMPTVKTIFS